MPMHKLRLALVTTHPPGKGSLNEYAYHFVRFLRHKEEVAEVILLVDHLEDGEQYQFEDHPHYAPVRVVPCWDFGRSDNVLRIRSAVVGAAVGTGVAIASPFCW